MKKYLFLFLFAYSNSLKAAPVSFDFIQGGFDERASVTGMFTGEDFNGDGVLFSPDGEVTEFMMEFSGNSILPPFSLGSNDPGVLSDFDGLFFLVYDLDGSSLGDDLSVEVETSAGRFFLEESMSINQRPDRLGYFVSADFCNVGPFCGVVSDNATGGPLPFFGPAESFSDQLVSVSPKVAPIPVPAAVWLFGSALLGLVGISKKGSRYRQELDPVTVKL